MDSTAIIKAVLDGDADDTLDGISAAVKERRALAARVNFHTFKQGDKVRLTNLRPRYLIGAPATIVEKKQTRIAIKIDQDWLDRNPQAKSRWSGPITASPNMLEPVA